MNDKCLFSIIIPVYNAEKTVMRTLQSLLLQTFKNYEIILVNDGSKDNCAAILEEFKQYNNFKSHLLRIMPELASPAILDWKRHRVTMLSLSIPTTGLTVISLLYFISTFTQAFHNLLI